MNQFLVAVAYGIIAFIAGIFLFGTLWHAESSDTDKEIQGKGVVIVILSTLSALAVFCLKWANYIDI